MQKSASSRLHALTPASRLIEAVSIRTGRLTKEPGCRMLLQSGFRILNLFCRSVSKPFTKEKDSPTVNPVGLYYI